MIQQFQYFPKAYKHTNVINSNNLMKKIKSYLCQ